MTDWTKNFWINGNFTSWDHIEGRLAGGGSTSAPLVSLSWSTFEGLSFSSALILSPHQLLHFLCCSFTLICSSWPAVHQLNGSVSFSCHQYWQFAPDISYRCTMYPSGAFWSLQCKPIYGNIRRAPPGAEKKSVRIPKGLDVKVVGHTQNKVQGSKRKSRFNGILVETLLHWSSIRIWENLRMEKLASVLHRNLSLGSVLCTLVATNSHFRLSSKWQKALACLASVPSCLCCPSAPPSVPDPSPFVPLPCCLGGEQRVDRCCRPSVWSAAVKGRI